MIHGEGAGPCWLAGAFEPFEAVAHVAKGRRDSEEGGCWSRRTEEEDERRVARTRERERERHGVFLERSKHS